MRNGNKFNFCILYFGTYICDVFEKYGLKKLDQI